MAVAASERERALERPRLHVLVVTNQWPRRNQPQCGIMVVREVGSLARVGVAAEVIPIAGAVRDYVRAALSVLRLNVGPRRYDLIHAHTGHSGFLACLQVRYPVVFSYVGYDLDTPADDREGLRTQFERLVFRQLSRVVAGTITKSARGQARLPAAGRARNTLLSSGVDRSLFAPMERAEARGRLGWNHDRPVVLFAGDPTRMTKRFPLAEATLAAARRRLPELELAVCDRVPPSKVPLWMNAADALLLTSVAEGSPNVVKEAMACNLPVVSVDVGDVRDVVEGTRHCHVCSDDPEELARGLLEVAAPIPERSDGRERTAELGLDAVATRLRDVYDRALTRGPGPLGFLSPPRLVSAR
jgi:teichuronic acid biosynthesis glycosyltransferase TuaC